jgi:hypothetical protein
VEYECTSLQERGRPWLIESSFKEKRKKDIEKKGIFLFLFSAFFFFFLSLEFSFFLKLFFFDGKTRGKRRKGFLVSSLQLLSEPLTRRT